MFKYKKIIELYEAIHEPYYDDLNDYLKGVRDMLNFLNDDEEDISIYNYIMSEIKKNNDIQYGYYYQIDYIDNSGLANYIATFDDNERDKAIQALRLLNKANACISKGTKYILDRYRYQLENGLAIDDSDEVIEPSIEE